MRSRYYSNVHSPASIVLRLHVAGSGPGADVLRLRSGFLAGSTPSLVYGAPSMRMMVRLRHSSRRVTPTRVERKGERGWGGEGCREDRRSPMNPISPMYLFRHLLIRPNCKQACMHLRIQRVAIGWMGKRARPPAKVYQRARQSPFGCAPEQSWRLPEDNHHALANL